MKKSDYGFTLIEILVVISILGVLMGLVTLLVAGYLATLHLALLEVSHSALKRRLATLRRTARRGRGGRDPQRRQPGPALRVGTAGQ